MFTLFYGLYKYLFKKDEFFVLILGLDNAGKTVRISYCSGVRFLAFHCVQIVCFCTLSEYDVLSLMYLIQLMIS